MVNPLQQATVPSFVIPANDGFLEIETLLMAPFQVDTGTTLAYLPAEYAEAINAAFDPPSVFVKKEGLFQNYCNASPPEVAINIGGTYFKISSAELLLPKSQADPNTGLCVCPMLLVPHGADTNCI